MEINMSEPRVGDKIPLQPCSVCGGEQWSEYKQTRSASRYDDDFATWVRVVHLEAPGPKYATDYLPCIRFLVERVKKLERNANNNT